MDFDELEKKEEERESLVYGNVKIIAEENKRLEGENKKLEKEHNILKE